MIPYDLRDGLDLHFISQVRGPYRIHRAIELQVDAIDHADMLLEDQIREETP